MVCAERSRASCGTRGSARCSLMVAGLAAAPARIAENCGRTAANRHARATELEWRLAAGSVAAPPTLERPSANRNDEKQAAGERADTHRL